MKSVVDIADGFLEAIDLEKRSDIELVNQLLNQLSAKKLAQRGLATINLNVSNIRTGLGGKTFIELSNDNGYTTSDEIDNGDIKVGDIVKVEQMSSGSSSASSSAKKGGSSKKSGSKSMNSSKDQDKAFVEGVVTKITLKVIVVGIEENFEESVLQLLNDRVWICKISNAITYNRMESTMRKMKELKKLTPLMQVLLGQSEFSAPDRNSLDHSLKSITFHNEALNNSQRSAINFALNSDVSIIHGPPGTGKTYTIIELIQQLLETPNKKFERILVCGPSNISVDTIIERLDKVYPSQIIRIGHPARLLPSIQKHSLEVLTKTNEAAELVKDIKTEINDILKDIKKSKSYKERKQFYQDLKYLKRDLREREQKAVQNLVLNSKVVVATLHGSSSRELVKVGEALGVNLFDCLIIDEVSQSLEPSCWIPLIYHQGIKKLVLAGDNKQLPPTIKLDDHGILNLGTKTKAPSLNKIQASKQILETTIFDRLVKLYPNSGLAQLLNVQYRMNKTIMEFSSKMLYNNKLMADASVANRLLNDVAGIEGTEDTEVPVIWYDTQGGDFPEQKESDELSSASAISGSLLNENEACLALLHIEQLINAHVPVEMIGVISPYNAQVSLIKHKISAKYPGIEISTIDGFQGREKDVIILSLVRSNDEKNVGFLKDERRLNVAITRPKRQLCVIGDMETIGESKVPFLRKWVSWAEEYAEIRYPQLEDVLEFA